MDTNHDMALRVFWMLATIEVGLAIRLALELRRAMGQPPDPRRSALAQGQGKDNWLVSAVVWMVLPSEGWPFRSTLVLCAVIVVAWLLWRTMHRLRMLRRAS